MVKLSGFGFNIVRFNLFNKSWKMVLSISLWFTVYRSFILKRILDNTIVKIHFKSLSFYFMIHYDITIMLNAHFQHCYINLIYFNTLISFHIILIISQTLHSELLNCVYFSQVSMLINKSISIFSLGKQWQLMLILLIISLIFNSNINKSQQNNAQEHSYSVWSLLWI